MRKNEPLPLEERIVEALRAQWARVNATQIYLEGGAIEARIIMTQQSVRVEVHARTSRIVDNAPP